MLGLILYRIVLLLCRGVGIVMLRVRNLGPIKEGSIELKPLTVFIGPNNTGKTYLAYLVMGLVDDLKFKSKLLNLLLNNFRNNFNEISRYLKLDNKDLENFLKKGIVHKRINIKDFILNNAELLGSLFEEISHEINTSANKFLKRYWRFLGSDIILSEDSKVSIYFSFEVDKLLESIYTSEIDTGLIGFGFSTVHKQINSYILDLKLDLQLLSDVDIPEYKEILNIFLNYTILHILLSFALFPFLGDVAVFPAQRNTLMIDFIKSAINIASREELEGFIFDDSENINKKKITVYKLEKLVKSKPILNFLELVDLFVPSKSERSKFYEIGKKLENILGGNVTVTEDGEIRFRLNDEKSLKLTVSSSMVQQLSPLALYLKHLAKPNDLVIIDEPESNLHPEAQKRMVEVIAEMVNRGLCVIITTHSPFIIDYLNTLMKAYSVSNMSSDAKNKVLKVIKDENVLIDPDKVGVYLFKGEGIIENAKNEDIIDLNSFRKIIDEIGATFTELLIIEDDCKDESCEEHEAAD